MLRSKTTSFVAGLFAVLVLAILLSGCKSGDKKNPTATQAPALTAAATAETPEANTTVEPVSPSTSEPGPTLTPYLLPSDALFQEAANRARIDLATQLTVSIERIKVLDLDTVLLLPAPLQCPEITREGVNPYYVYVQADRFIYPYQFYTLPQGGDMVVEKCEDKLVDQEVLYVPTPDSSTAVVEKVKADLQSRGIDPARGQLEVRTISWTDEALGCRVASDQPTPAPALIDGYIILYTLDGTPYEYHTDLTGDHVVYCAPPPVTESVEAFIAQLQTVEDLGAEVIQDEPAHYQGLDAEGVHVAITDSAYRIGVFGFDTPEAARNAAKKINDEDVSHIFVSGKVLIVQEENSPRVYSTLLTYAEEVRAPILERQREEAATEEPTMTETTG